MKFTDKLGEKRVRPDDAIETLDLVGASKAYAVEEIVSTAGVPLFAGQSTRPESGVAGAKIHLSAAPIDNFFAGLQRNARVLHGKGVARWLKV